MARAIDAGAVKRRAWDIAEAWKDQGRDYEALLLESVVEQIVDTQPTLTPPNEWVNRVRELDELYTKLQIVTGFTAEQLLEIFAAGYTLEKPDYSKKFAEMENLAEAAQPNEPLTLEELRKMDGEPVYMTFPSDTGNQCGHWALVGTQRWGAVSLIYGCGWSSYESAVETLGAKFYRRPPEGEDET